MILTVSHTTSPVCLRWGSQNRYGDIIATMKQPLFPVTADASHGIPYVRGVAYATAADAYGWHHADPDADCPFTGAAAVAWHRGVDQEARRQHDAAKRCSSYFYPASI